MKKKLEQRHAIKRKIVHKVDLTQEEGKIFNEEIELTKSKLLASYHKRLNEGIDTR